MSITIKEALSLLKEAVISDKIKKLFDECVSDLKRIGYQIDDDIILEESSTASRFGDITSIPDDNGMYRLRISKYLNNETDERIKDTLLHELAHYIVDKKAIRYGIFTQNSRGHWTILPGDRGRWLGHGSEWKNVIGFINLRLGTELSRTGDSDVFRKAAEDRIKYYVTCKNCGVTLPYMKSTKFVKDPNAKNPYNGHYIWACGTCGKSGQFEVKENK